MSNQPDPLVNIPRLETIMQAYQAELRDTIEFYVSDIARLRRIKETAVDNKIKELVTGIIQDEITIMYYYRKELL